MDILKPRRGKRHTRSKNAKKGFRKEKTDQKQRQRTRSKQEKVQGDCFLIGGNIKTNHNYKPGFSKRMEIPKQ